MNASSAHQENPLDTRVHVTFPPTAHTIGAALEHLLAPSGWRLADSADPAIKDRMQQALPENQRSLGPVRLIDAVKALCGDFFTLVVDPANRLISCELRKSRGSDERQ